MFGLGLLNDLNQIGKQKEASVGILWGIHTNEMCCGIVGIGNLNMHHIAVEG